MIKIIFFVLLFSHFQKVSAHEFLTEILIDPEDISYFLPGSVYDEIETFELTEEDLLEEQSKSLVNKEIKKIVARKRQITSIEDIACNHWSRVFETCGEFDDWNKGRLFAINICTGITGNYQDIYPNGLIPQFIGPSTFVDVNTAAGYHHSDYQFSHGLIFNCVGVISYIPTN